LVKLQEKYKSSLNFSVSLSYVAILVITGLIILFISFDICKIVSLFKIQGKKIKRNDFLEQIISNKEPVRNRRDLTLNVDKRVLNFELKRN
jgi:hypothetical protein